MNSNNTMKRSDSINNNNNQNQNEVEIERKLKTISKLIRINNAIKNEPNRFRLDSIEFDQLMSELIGINESHELLLDLIQSMLSLRLWQDFNQKQSLLDNSILISGMKFVQKWHSSNQKNDSSSFLLDALNMLESMYKNVNAELSNAMSDSIVTKTLSGVEKLELELRKRTSHVSYVVVLEQLFNALGKQTNSNKSSFLDTCILHFGSKIRDGFGWVLAFIGMGFPTSILKYALESRFFTNLDDSEKLFILLASNKNQLLSDNQFFEARIWGSLIDFVSLKRPIESTSFFSGQLNLTKLTNTNSSNQNKQTTTRVLLLTFLLSSRAFSCFVDVLFESTTFTEFLELLSSSEMEHLRNWFLVSILLNMNELQRKSYSFIKTIESISSSATTTINSSQNLISTAKQFRSSLVLAFQEVSFNRLYVDRYQFLQKISSSTQQPSSTLISPVLEFLWSLESHSSLLIENFLETSITLKSNPERSEFWLLLLELLGIHCGELIASDIVFQLTSRISSSSSELLACVSHLLQSFSIHHGPSILERFIGLLVRKLKTSDDDSKCLELLRRLNWFLRIENISTNKEAVVSESFEAALKQQSISMLNALSSHWIEFLPLAYFQQNDGIDQISGNRSLIAFRLLTLIPPPSKQPNASIAVSKVFELLLISLSSLNYQQQQQRQEKIDLCLELLKILSSTSEYSYVQILALCFDLMVSPLSDGILRKSFNNNNNQNQENHVRGNSISSVSSQNALLGLNDSLFGEENGFHGQQPQQHYERLLEKNRTKHILEHSILELRKNASVPVSLATPLKQQRQQNQQQNSQHNNHQMQHLQKHNNNNNNNNNSNHHQNGTSITTSSFEIENEKKNESLLRRNRAIICRLLQFSLNNKRMIGLRGIDSVSIQPSKLAIEMFISRIHHTFAVTSDEQYSEALPRRFHFPMDEHFFRLFSQNPILYDTMNLLAESDAPEFSLLYITLKSLLAIHVTLWNGEFNSNPKCEATHSQHFQSTSSLLQCLKSARWLPYPLDSVNLFLEKLAPKEISDILMILFNFLRVIPPAFNKDGKRLYPQEPLSISDHTAAIRNILFKNIQTLGSFYPMFSIETTQQH